MSTTQERPDLSQIPKFPAFLKWIHKLESWCKEAVLLIEHLKEEVDDMRQERDAAVESEDWARRMYDMLMEDLEDVPRGIRTLEEVMDRLEAEDDRKGG
jgi:hypothetical protein